MPDCPGAPRAGSPPRCPVDGGVDGGAPSRPGPGRRAELSTLIDSLVPEIARESARGPQLLPPPSRVGLDRRDAHHGRPRRRGAIRRNLGDRARLSAGAVDDPAGARHFGDRSRTRHRALYARRARPRGPARGGLPRPRGAASVRPRARARNDAVLSRGRVHGPARRAAHAQRGILQAHRRHEFHAAARRRAAAARHRGGRRGARRRQPHLQDADGDLSRQPRV